MFRTLKNTILSAGKSIDGFKMVDTVRGKNIDVEVLKALLKRTNDPKVIEELELDIKKFEYGDYGENSVLYELKNADVPMYCFHNVYIKLEDRTAQIDLLVVTEFFICTIEVKALSGDVKVHSDGQFERIIRNKNGKIIKKTSMYSPIEQNARHARLLRKLLKDNKLINNCPVHNLVVLSRAESKLDTKYAKKDIKKIIIKADQVHNKMVEYKDDPDCVNMPLKSVDEIVAFIKGNDKIHATSYENPMIAKYSKAIVESMSKNTESSTVEVIPLEKKSQTKKKNIKPVNYAKHVVKAVDSAANKDSVLDKKLREYRKLEAKRNDIKPYMVFYDKHLEDLIRQKPKTAHELKKCSGFGDVKVKKYGEHILKIIAEHV